MRAAIRAHLNSHHVSRVIYGSIIGLALIVALGLHPPKVGFVIGSLLGTGIAVGLAELYSEVLGTETRSRQRPTREQVRSIFHDVLAVFAGVAFPVVFFVLAAVGLWSLDAAFMIAKWTGLGLICFYGFCGARLAGNGVARSLVEGFAVGLIGGALILLKSLLH